jgi:DNA-binding response OmpR family regulator
MSNLLFIDDDKELLLINNKYFSREGYHVEVATNAASGISILKNFAADCIILDVMMPGLDGFDAIKRLKAVAQVPVIFLTGRSFEDDKVKGLLLGADDYMIKPYSLKELSARIKVQTRRLMSSHSPNLTVISYPPLTINLTKHKAFYYNEEITLSNREYELLYLLASKSNQIITYEDIGISMWGTYSETDRRTIMVTASRLRKKLEDYFGLSEYIETVWTRGYKFVPK